MAKGVQYSQALIQSLEKSLRSAFNQPYVRLTRQPNNPGAAFHVRLENAPKIAQVDGNLEQMVVEMLTVDRRATNFWFGFGALFVIGEIRKYTLQHASLAVFHDISGEPIPLFRAEWDQLGLSPESKHAQPHWHFVQRPERIEGIVRTHMKPSGETTTEFATEEKSELFSGLVDCGKFHFAMASLWEKGGTPYKRSFDSDDFPEWFNSLTDYIAGQIDYLVSHMPLSETPTARVFAPTATAT